MTTSVWRNWFDTGGIVASSFHSALCSAHIFHPVWILNKKYLHQNNNCYKSFIEFSIQETDKYRFRKITHCFDQKSIGQRKNQKAIR